MPPDAVRAASKPSDSAHLGQDRHETPPQPPPQRPRLQVELVCQPDTNALDPIRDSPRLTPAFVTQLLGQVMAPERHRLMRGVYGAAATKNAVLLDTRL